MEILFCIQLYWNYFGKLIILEKFRGLKNLGVLEKRKFVEIENFWIIDFFWKIENFWKFWGLEFENF